MSKGGLQRAGFASWQMIHSQLPNIWNRHDFRAISFILLSEMKLWPAHCLSPTRPLFFFSQGSRRRAYRLALAVVDSAVRGDGTELSSSGAFR